MKSNTQLQHVLIATMLPQISIAHTAHTAYHVAIPALGNLEAPALPEDHVVRRYSHLLETHLCVAVGRIVISYN